MIKLYNLLEAMKQHLNKWKLCRPFGCKTEDHKTENLSKLINIIAIQL